MSKGKGFVGVEAWAAAVAASPSAASRPDFLPRAAACHLMAASGNADLFRFRSEAVWPGRLEDFHAGVGRQEHLARAAALLALCFDA
jgi:hypothetical protein